MANTDDPLPRHGQADRFGRLVGEFAEDEAFDAYFPSRPPREDAPEPPSDRSDPRDPGIVGEPPDADALEPEAPPPRRRLRWRLLKWGAKGGFGFLLLLVGWLALLVPVSRTAEPLVPPPIILTASDGTPIARMGPVMDRPVEIDELPDHVVEAFLAIEDRRFYDHWGIDPRGIGRAIWNNLTSSSREGGSTITQQLAKLTYLSSDRTIGRKVQEVPIAFWLELWLSKDEILERYLSNAYFGDNVYGLRAASLHYFYRHPENLTLTQAAMLAGLVRAPSRLAPTRNLEG
ncbi:MAG: transglycosylase domain-containing protein, partial [Sphingomonadaceae bacterium]|nr:transglycosylase domain-containing protein [Sphingomonadaceae bacterium]